MDIFGYMLQALIDPQLLVFLAAGWAFILVQFLVSLSLWLHHC